MCLPEKWREPETSALPECTRIFLSPCLSVISVTISTLSRSLSPILGLFCALTLILASVSSGVAVPGLFRGVPGGSSGVSRGLFRGVPGPFQDTNIYLVCILLPWAIFFGGGQARREGVWAA
jgi:hypothetical protein